MTTVLIVIHLMVVVAMVGLVLLQRSEGGALGIGGGSGAFMTGRGAANVLTRSTGILAAAFFVTSIGLALLSRLEMGPSDIFQSLPGQTAPATAETPVAPTTLPSGGGTAEEMLRELNTGPQTPPAESGGADTSAPAAAENAPAAAENAPAATEDAPAAAESAPAATESAPAATGDGATSQTPPAEGGSGQ